MVSQSKQDSLLCWEELINGNEGGVRYVLDMQQFAMPSIASCLVHTWSTYYNASTYYFVSQGWVNDYVDWVVKTLNKKQHTIKFQYPILDIL